VRLQELGYLCLLPRTAWLQSQGPVKAVRIQRALPRGCHLPGPVPPTRGVTCHRGLQAPGGRQRVRQLLCQSEERCPRLNGRSQHPPLLREAQTPRGAPPQPAPQPCPPPGPIAPPPSADHAAHPPVSAAPCRRTAAVGRGKGLGQAPGPGGFAGLRAVAVREAEGSWGQRGDTGGSEKGRSEQEGRGKESGGAYRHLQSRAAPRPPAAPAWPAALPRPPAPAHPARTRRSRQRFLKISHGLDFSRKRSLRSSAGVRAGSVGTSRFL